FPELLRNGFHADVVTDQTSAHDPLGGYVPRGLSLPEADALRREPEDYEKQAYASMAERCAAMVGFQDAGAIVFDYGNNLRAGSPSVAITSMPEASPAPIARPKG